MPTVLVSPPAVEPVTYTDAKAHMRITATDEDTLIGQYAKSARLWCEQFTRRQFIKATWRVVMDAFPSYKIELPYAPLAVVNSITYVDTDGDWQTLGEWGERTATVTADASTDILTASGHYLKTGEPVQFSTTGTLPGGLSANTTYYAGVVSSSTFKLYTDRYSAINATAAQKVDITSAGSGTHTLLIGNTLYAVNYDVEPALVAPSYGNTWPSTRDQDGAVVVEFVCGYGAAATEVPEDIKTAIKILTAHLFENREAVSVVQLYKVPMAVESLLWPHRVLEVG